MTKGLVNHVEELQLNPTLMGSRWWMLSRKPYDQICILEKSFWLQAGQWTGEAETRGREVIQEAGGSGKGRERWPRLSRGKK